MRWIPLAGPIAICTLALLASSLMPAVQAQEPHWNDNAVIVSVLDSLTAPSTYRRYINSDSVEFTEMVSSRFLHVDDFLVVETLRNEWDSRMDGVNGRIHLTSWRLPRKPGDTPVWQREIMGNGGEIAANGLYRVERWGCCGEINPDEYYSFRDGSPVIRSTSNIWSIFFDNGPHLFVGFDLTHVLPVSMSPLNNSGDLIGVVSVVSESGDTLTWVRLYSPPDGPCWGDGEDARIDIVPNGEVRVYPSEGRAFVSSRRNSPTADLVLYIRSSQLCPGGEIHLQISPSGIAPDAITAKSRKVPVQSLLPH